MKIKILGLTINIIQILVIVVIYAINPTGVLYQAGWLFWCIIGSVGPSVIVTAKGRVRIIGLIMEGVYWFALYQLYCWVMYYSGLPIL